MNKNMIAVIQAGGKGTRMYSLTKDMIPKPMLLLNGKPLLQWQIEYIAKFGITEFVVIVGHLGEKVIEYFGDGRKWNLSISYIKEAEPLGSAGALFYLTLKETITDFLFVFGDIMFELDWDRVITFHKSHKGQATLIVHPNTHPYDSDLVIVGKENMVIGIDLKNRERDYWYDNCVNAGIYVFSRMVLEQFTQLRKQDLEKDILLPMIKEGLVYAYHTPEYVKDVGTPERFRKAVTEQKRGIWSIKCLKKKQRAIFLDRDGTINKYCGLLYKEEDFILEDGVIEAIRRINEEGYLVIVITNQPVVARGMCGIEDVKKIHQKMQVLLGEGGAYLDEIVFCPHHPDKGYPEENPEYKVLCECRKPKTGMIKQMVMKYHINLSQSYLIGDSTIDIQTGIYAGVKTVLVKTGQAGLDKKYVVTADYKAENLLEAVEIILEEEKEKKHG